MQKLDAMLAGEEVHNNYIQCVKKTAAVGARSQRLLSSSLCAAVLYLLSLVCEPVGCCLDSADMTGGNAGSVRDGVL